MKDKIDPIRASIETVNEALLSISRGKNHTEEQARRALRDAAIDLYQIAIELNELSGAPSGINAIRDAATGAEG